MANQIKELFGCIPDELEKFAMASQISQAEAFKFFIELFRLNRFKRTGIIWWNLIDGWPQFSDAVVDYYFRKKLAYYYIRQVQRPVLLAFAEPKDWEISLQGVNDTEDEAVLRWKVKEYEGHSSKEAASGTAVLDHEVRTLWKTEFSHGEKKIYLIEWEWKGEIYKNHYLCGQPPFDLAFYEEFVKDVYGLECWK